MGATRVRPAVLLLAAAAFAFPPAGGEARALQERPPEAAAPADTGGAALVRERFDPESARRILAAADAAARAGAPRELVYEKALEGAAKGVPTPRVVAAVETFAERVARGAGLLGGRAAESEVSSAAEALERGVPPEHVRALSRDAAGGSLSVALLVLADLVEIGLPAAEARAVVTEALRADQGERGLLELEARIRGMVRRGVSPEQAAAEARAALRRGELPDPPR